MYRTLVVSVLLYGSEAWATTLADRRRLDVFDMRCQRRLLCVFWQQHVSNQSIRERTKQPTASSLLRQRRLRWFGHLHRMPSSLPVRRVFDFNPNIHGWKRPRGRPKTRWADSVKRDLHSAGLDSINAAQMVYDRPQWKAFVCGLPTLEPEHGPYVSLSLCYFVFILISWCLPYELYLLRIHFHSTLFSHCLRFIDHLLSLLFALNHSDCGFSIMFIIFCSLSSIAVASSSASLINYYVGMLLIH